MGRRYRKLELVWLVAVLVGSIVVAYASVREAKEKPAWIRAE